MCFEIGMQKTWNHKTYTSKGPIFICKQSQSWQCSKDKIDLPLDKTGKEDIKTLFNINSAKLAMIQYLHLLN